MRKKTLFPDRNRQSFRMRMIIGYFGVWVLLTYLNVVSAIIGSYLALTGQLGYAILCLMICGFCDMFDGPVARMRKRTGKEEGYGIQIDALADIVSFGVFPVVLGYSIDAHLFFNQYVSFGVVISIAIAAVFILAGVTRLAYFTVIEIELYNRKEKRLYYEGMPVTFVAILIPLVYTVCTFFGIEFPSVYNFILLIFALAFVIRMRIPKVGGRTLLFFIPIGLPIAVYLIWSIVA